MQSETAERIRLASGARSFVRLAAAAALCASLGLPVAAQGTAPTPEVAVTAGANPAPAEPPLAEVPSAAPAAIPAPAVKKAQELTPVGMFLGADPVVQGVMVLLMAASVLTWAILLVRGVSLFLAKRRLRRNLMALRAAESLEVASERIRRGVCAHLLVEVDEEIGLSQGLPAEGIRDRVAIALLQIEAAAAKRMAVGTGILATVGSIGPFVGLFGTVWGIMRSFIGIANTNTTNLAVVAPGIAEALLATGIGLVAAIPAVVIYNALARSIAGYRAMTGDASALILRHLSRELDRRAVAAFAPKATVRVAAE